MIGKLTFLICFEFVNHFSICTVLFETLIMILCNLFKWTVSFFLKWMLMTSRISSSKWHICCWKITPELHYLACFIDSKNVHSFCFDDFRFFKVWVSLRSFHRMVLSALHTNLSVKFNSLIVTPLFYFIDILEIYIYIWV